eukprot:c16993_g1_i1 orf=193-435(-)
MHATQPLRGVLGQLPPRYLLDNLHIMVMHNFGDRNMVPTLAMSAVAKFQHHSSFEISLLASYACVISPLPSQSSTYIFKL